MNKINKDVSKSEVKATKQVNDVQKEFKREVKFWNFIDAHGSLFIFT